MNKEWFLDEFPKWVASSALVAIILLLVGAALNLQEVMDVSAKFLGVSLLLMILFLLYDTLFRPWQIVKEQLIEIERQLEILNGRFARLHAFMIAPWLNGDVEKTKEFLRMKKSLKQRELAIYAVLNSKGAS